jgi:predicted DNA-binding transcriptional regulator AlpA
VESQVTISGLEELVSRIVEEKLRERDADGYLNAGDAARFLGLTPKALYARVARDQIPFKRNGKRVFFSRAELRAWMEDPTRED